MKVELELGSMSCNHCKMAVTDALQEIEGISTEAVEIGRAVVSSENWNDVAEAVGEVLEEEGYPIVSVKSLG
jgi:copper chaperone